MDKQLIERAVEAAAKAMSERGESETLMWGALDLDERTYRALAQVGVTAALTEAGSSIEMDEKKEQEMSEQQQFQPGDKVKVTAELIVVDAGDDFQFSNGTIYPLTVQRWADECDHITVELIERPEPPLEPGLHLCVYQGRPLALRWDGENWRWPGQGNEYVTLQNLVTVIGSITLNEEVEL